MIRLIAAVSKNGVIGQGNDLIFRDKEDMKHFRETTEGGVVAMGFNTWESIGSKPLPNRENWIFTKDPDKGMNIIDNDNYVVFVAPDVEDFIQDCKLDKEDVFFIGGGKIYETVIPHADELIISEFHEEAEGDTFFPEIDSKIWILSKSKEFTNFTLKIYKRRKL